jgi:hypothetical protein
MQTSRLMQSVSFAAIYQTFLKQNIYTNGLATPEEFAYKPLPQCQQIFWACCVGGCGQFFHIVPGAPGVHDTSPIFVHSTIVAIRSESYFDAIPHALDAANFHLSQFALIN